MATVVRTQLQKSNPYYISKHRRLELVHFCLQYPEWKEYLSSIKCRGTRDEFSDPTGEEAVKRVLYSRNIDMIERCCMLSAPDIYEYLLKSVIKGESYVLLATKYNMPCSKDYFYSRYHKFWFILSQEKHML